MSVVRKNLETFLDRNGKSLADASEITIRHSDHSVLTAIAGVWQGADDSVALSWNCYSDDGFVSVRLADRTPDW